MPLSAFSHIKMGEGGEYAHKATDAGNRAGIKITEETVKILVLAQGFLL